MTRTGRILPIKKTRKTVSAHFGGNGFLLSALPFDTKRFIIKTEFL